MWEAILKKSIFELIEKGRVETLKKRIKKNPQELKAQDELGHTPAIVAAMDNKAEALAVMIAQDASIMKDEMLGDNPIHHAARQGSAEAVRVMIDYNSKLLSAKNSREDMPPVLAVRRKKLKALRVMLDKDLSILDLEDDEGRKLPFLAQHLGFKEGLALMLQKKPEIGEWVDAEGHKLSDLVGSEEILEASKSEVVEDVDFSEGKHPEKKGKFVMKNQIFEYIINYDVEALRDLIARQPGDLKKKMNEQGITPAMWAVTQNKPECLKVMIEADQSILLDKDVEGNLPMHFAGRNGVQEETIKVVVNANPDLWAVSNNKGQKPFDVAVKNGNTKAAARFFTAKTRKANEPERHTLIEEIGEQAIEIEKQDESIEVHREDILSRKAWPGYKENLLSAVFGDEERSQDFEKALDHLARHARVLSPHSKSGQAKKQAIITLLNDLREKGASEGLGGVQNLIEDELAKPTQKSDLTRYRPGFFGAYKWRSKFLHKRGVAHYEFINSMGESRTAVSRTDHYLMELCDAAATASAHYERFDDL